MIKYVTTHSIINTTIVCLFVSFLVNGYTIARYRSIVIATIVRIVLAIMTSPMGKMYVQTNSPYGHEMWRDTAVLVKTHVRFKRSPTARFARNRFFTLRNFGTLAIVRMTKIFPGTPIKKMALYKMVIKVRKLSLLNGSVNAGLKGGLVELVELRYGSSLVMLKVVAGYII